MTPLAAFRRLGIRFRNRWMRLRKENPSRDQEGESHNCNRKEQNLNCPLLQLPVDVIFLISQALSPPDEAVFSQVCCSLRAILGSNLAATLSRDQHLEYLASLARDLPEQWVCEVCVALHRVTDLDTPEKPQHMTCPQGWDSWRFKTYSVHRYRLNRNLLQVEHRHIQLALKYIRVRDHGYRNYLQKLLAPYHDDNFTTRRYQDELSDVLRASYHDDNFVTQPDPNELPKVVTVQYSVYPKIAVGADGNPRFMTLSVWQYHMDRESVSLDAMGDLVMCPHLRFRADSPPIPDFRPDELGNAINAAIHAAIHVQSKDAEVCGACARCHTDYLVRATQDCLELRAWQDLGPEGSPMSQVWRDHVFDLRQTVRDIKLRRLFFSHDPGSIRALYDSGGL